jgi:flagellar basal-body rod modification protein FlgD
MSTTTSLTPAALLGAAQSSAAAQASASAATSNTGSSAASSTGTTALQSLASNFNQFLNLLMTQLQNQDPTNPMDTDQFTTELVQFTGVQQQVATNTSLSQLITLTQSGQVLDSSQLVGKQAIATANEISLQNGHGEISFNGTAGQQVAVAVVNSSGATIRSASFTAQSGTNVWTWDGKDDAGNAVPDGAYRIAVEADQNGTATALPVSVIGTVTGLARNGTSTTLDIGALPVDIGSVQSLSS